MPKQAYGRRYAQAVFELALEKNELEKWQADLRKVADTVKDKEFLEVLESPRIKPEDKSRLIATVLPDLAPLAMNLLHLLIARSGIGMISDIAAEYERLLDSYRGIEPAEVITAVPLDEKDKQKLAERLAAVVGKEVTLKSEVDPEILGGIIARVGGKLLDGSTRSKLAALKKELVGAERKQ
jgi:F-type H+-transporting ATPase subunit delta